MAQGLFNITDGCPWPFLPVANYPYTGGLLSSRYCQESFLETGAVCCLPCPVTNWIYEDNFTTVSTVTNWLSVGGFICCVFLLLSFLCLPVTRTSRHYLTIGLIVGVALINLGFMVPLWAKPSECYDAITVNDMYTSMACAWSGALVLYGGQSAVMWVFNRSLSLHLQICWQRVPGKKSFYAAQFVGWGIPALVTGVSLGVSGVAFRFGNVCHINHDNSLAAFWGPTLAFAGIAAILQFTTLGYVCKVYLRNLWDPNTTSAATSSMRSGPGTLTDSTFQSKSVRATYRRVKKVLALQWRGIVVVMIVLISAVYFAVIFNVFDQLGTVAMKDRSKTENWIVCIVLNNGDKSKCFNDVAPFTLGESIVSAVLVLLSVMGYWCLLFLGRLSMFVGWWELVKRPFETKDNFVSVDARRISDPRNYEMLTSPPQSYHITKSASGALVATIKPTTHNQAIDFDTTDKDFGADYFAEPELPPPIRSYSRKESSFSQPIRPARSISNQRVSFQNGDSPEIAHQATEWPSYRQYHSTSPTQHWNEYTPTNNNPHTARARSPSITASNGRSGSALGREWPTPAPRAAAGSPTPLAGILRSNSRAGTGSALSNRPTHDWDYTTSFA